jgi:hypothetical protein
MRQRRSLVVACAAALAITINLPAAHAEPRGSGAYVGYSDERNGFTCRTALFAAEGTFAFGGHRFNGPFRITFTGCPDGVHPGPDLLYLKGTDALGRRLNARCGVHTHECTGFIRPAGAPAPPGVRFRWTVKYATSQIASGLYAITGTYRQP